MNSIFTQKLNKNGLLFGDGAMGTMLYSRGVFVNTCFEHLNVSRPELVRQVHEEYAASGVDFVKSNTFGANRLKLSRYGLGEQTEQIVSAGVKLARESCQADMMTAASIGPLGADIGSYDRDMRAKASEVFAEQVKISADAGADVLLFETFSNCDELICAIEAAAKISDLEIIAHMTINDSTETDYGSRIDESMCRLCRYENVAAVGLNCSTGPAAMLESIELVRGAVNKPLSVQPNAGYPRNVDGRTLYMCTPEYMAEYAKRFYEKGVKIIGGCCGTTPEHIAAIINAVRPIKKSITYKQPAIKIPAEPAERLKPAALETKSQFGAKLAAGEKVISIEVSPPRGFELSALIEKAKLCKDRGACTINIPDGPRASSRLSAMVTALMIEQKCGIETILHFCCRDRNIIGMQSDLLGIQATGLRNMLIVTGDPPKLGDFPDATAVFDLDSIALIKVIHELNRGIDIAGKSLGRRLELVIGAGANPAAAEPEREIQRYRQKIDAGAEYFITQPVFDDESLLRFLDTAGGSVPVIAGIWPFTSLKNAEFMANEVPGVSVPRRLLDRMSRAKSREDAIKTGIDISREMISRVEDAVAGFAVSAPFGNVNIALEAAGL
jgi:methionine synthase / methylenetetrahydrofolate reductase(NADPH)